MMISQENQDQWGGVMSELGKDSLIQGIYSHGGPVVPRRGLTGKLAPDPGSCHWRLNRSARAGEQRAGCDVGWLESGNGTERKEKQMFSSPAAPFLLVSPPLAKEDT